MRLMLAAICAVLAGALVCGCTRDASRSQAPQAEVPFVLVYLTPSYPIPGEPLLAGVRLAVWKDGTILRPTSFAKLEKPYLRGRLSDQELRQFRALLDEVRVTVRKTGEHSLIDDASATHLVIRGGGPYLSWAQSGMAAPGSAAATLIRWADTIPVTRFTKTDFPGEMPSGWFEDK